MRTLLVIVSFVFLGAGLIAAECVWLRGRTDARAVARANENVAARAEIARARMEAGRWDEAIRALDEALADERATERDEARAVLDQARRGQADALLEAARRAAARRDAAGALDLLRAYAAHPQAADPERARRLREDVERASSGAEADRLLARLSDEELTTFARDGRLGGDDGLHTDAARALFHDTLRRQLPHEMPRRAARREADRMAAEQRAAERARRSARLRATPAFRSLADFVARTREEQARRQELARRQEAELSQLFEQLDVNDPQEQAAIRSDLRGDDRPADLRKVVEEKRGEARRAYRTSPEFDPADRELFEQLVDGELNDLLKTLPAS